MVENRKTAGHRIYDLVLIETGGSGAFKGEIKSKLIQQYNPKILRYYPLTKMTPVQFTQDMAQKYRYEEFCSLEDIDIPFYEFVNNPLKRIIGSVDTINRLLFFDSNIETGTTLDRCVSTFLAIGYVQPFQIWTREGHREI